MEIWSMSTWSGWAMDQWINKSMDQRKCGQFLQSPDGQWIDGSMINVYKPRWTMDQWKYGQWLQSPDEQWINGNHGQHGSNASQKPDKG